MRPITARTLNRTTLRRQLLLERERLPVTDAVARIMAIQAQSAASPYLALWNRIEAFDPADLDRAFADHAVVKATLMRITLHAVLAEDYPRLHAAMASSLRASRLFDRRYKSTGLGATDADALLEPLLAYAREPRMNGDMEAWLTAHVAPEAAHAAWWAMRTFAPLVHAPAGGPWTFGPRPAYVSGRTRPHEPDGTPPLHHLVWRYLEAFGPATVQDVGQFSILSRPLIRQAIEALGEAVVILEGPGGEALYDVRGMTLEPDDTPAPPRLMAMWDSVLLAYADRGRLIPPTWRPHVIRRNGDVLPTILVDGLVAGTWRPTGEGIEATAFHPLADDAWAALDHEARGLLALIAPRDPAVYGRYGHWWPTLPAHEVRLLGR